VSGSLKEKATELGKFWLHLMGVQEDTMDNGGTEPTHDNSLPRKWKC
jgi:hypothetical protein